MKTHVIVLLGLICLAVPARAANVVSCKKAQRNQKSYTICQTNPQALGWTGKGGDRANLRTFLNDSHGKPYGSFQGLKDDLDATGFSLVFAVNGGMYHKDLSAVGYYVEKRIKSSEVNTRKGPGNFHLLPNGIFYIEHIDGMATMAVMEAKAFLKRAKRPDFATQSGPMLVINGQIHHGFTKGSISQKIRNGVGVLGDIAYFVNSDEPVNFFEFAEVFKDHLKVSNALYLDGTISSLYHPPSKRHDLFFPLGPIIAIVKPIKTDKKHIHSN